MNRKPATPKDASAIILTSGGKVLWAQRNPKIPFLGGWHAFPGGKVEAGDTEIGVENCADAETGKFIVSAVRECFEEVGVLVARGGEKLTKGQRASLHDDLVSGRSSFREILEHWNLWLDARDFEYTGFWTTPQFSPVRFKTRFFIAECPPKQTPYEAITEMLAPEFIAPESALQRWKNSEVIISPPVLITLQILADSENEIPTSKFQIPDSKLETELRITNYELPVTSEEQLTTNNEPTKNNAQILLEKSEAVDGVIDYVSFNPHVTVFPLMTETLPPATHTNCFIVGRREFVVIDPAAREAEEQAKLFRLIDEAIENGAICREIIVSHLHPDHTGGETVLRQRLHEKYGMETPISAHEKTIEALRGKVEFQKAVADGEEFHLRDETDESFILTALYTPGHARGHLCFYDETKGFLLSSDNVVSLGTVVIAPPEGNLSDYLASLEHMKNLPNLRFLCGSHGTAVFDARRKIEEYIAHRLEREKQIFEAFQAGARTPAEIVSRVYAGLAENLLKAAEKSVEAHLEKLSADGRI